VDLGPFREAFPGLIEALFWVGSIFAGIAVAIAAYHLTVNSSVFRWIAAMVISIAMSIVVVALVPAEYMWMLVLPMMLMWIMSAWRRCA
jgi:hypothetical protein